MLSIAGLSAPFYTASCAPAHPPIGTKSITLFHAPSRRPPSTYKKWKQKAERTKAKGQFCTITSTCKYTSLVDRERQEYKTSKAKWRSKEGFKLCIGPDVPKPTPSVLASGPYIPKVDIEHFRDKEDLSKFLDKDWRI